MHTSNINLSLDFLQSDQQFSSFTIIILGLGPNYWQI